MFAILAVILAGVGYVLDVAGAATARWDSPGALGLAALGCLALHLGGAPWPRKP